jgi:hypothetical protein
MSGKIKSLWSDLCYHLDCFMHSYGTDFLMELATVMYLICSLIVCGSVYITFMVCIYIIGIFWMMLYEAYHFIRRGGDE